MFKKILTGTVLTLSTIFAKTNTVPFSYEYEVIASNNQAVELIHMYEVKEYMILQYDNLIIDKKEDEIPQVMSENYHLLVCDEESIITYERGKVKIIIGDGKGIAIKGKFKRFYCDNNTVNGRYYILDQLFKD